LLKFSDDKGAGTVLAIGLIGAAVTLFLATALLANLWLHKLQLQQAAETAAISAADSLRGLSTGYPCDVARQIADLNMAKLVECRIVGFEVYIKVRIHALGIVLNAEALAGA
jgi:secretion/DNA translocation related TadE-like protein